MVLFFLLFSKQFDEGRILDVFASCLNGIFMKRQLEQRLKELRAEYASGQKTLAELENKQMNLKNTLLRIRTAIQVLEEELSQENSKEEDKTKQPIK